MEQGVYQETFMVANYECTIGNQMKLGYLLRHAQEIAGRQLDVQGYDAKALQAFGQVFLLSKIALKIHHIPSVGDVITCKTWARGTKGAYFLRDIYFEDQNGACVAEFATHWVLVDPENHRVVKPNQLKFQIALRPDLSVDAEPEKRLREPEMVHITDRMARYSDLDANGHVNNAIYADIICDFAQNNLRTQPITSFEIHYLHEAKLGDCISIYHDQSRSKEEIICGKIGKNPCFISKIVVL